MPKLLHSLLPKSLHFWLPFTGANLSDSYDREVFSTKTNLLMNHFIDMAVQGYGWLAA